METPLDLPLEGGHEKGGAVGGKGKGGGGRGGRGYKLGRRRKKKSRWKKGRWTPCWGTDLGLKLQEREEEEKVAQGTEGPQVCGGDRG